MSALGSYLLGNLVSVLVALVVVTIAFWKWKYQYWKKRNVPYLEPGIPFGNMEDVIRGKKFVGITLKGLFGSGLREEYNDQRLQDFYGQGHLREREGPPSSPSSESFWDEVEEYESEADSDVYVW
jgi:hypothetical protein